jgi:LuxR family glucitol operon transcriptional activator
MPDSKVEVHKLLENLLNYDAQPNFLFKPPFKLKTRWHQTNLKVDTTLENLLTAKIFEPAEAFSSLPSDETSNPIDRLRYLFKKILEGKLNIFEDDRVKNEHGKYQGMENWKFTLKLWHSPEEIQSSRIRSFFRITLPSN